MCGSPRRCTGIYENPKVRLKSELKNRAGAAANATGPIPSATMGGTSLVNTEIMEVTSASSTLQVQIIVW